MAKRERGSRRVTNKDNEREERWSNGEREREREREREIPKLNKKYIFFNVVMISVSLQVARHYASLTTFVNLARLMHACFG